MIVYHSEIWLFVKRNLDTILVLLSLVNCKNFRFWTRLYS